MIYEPEQFQGEILRISDPYKATILIFTSGKTVITGLTNSQHIKPVTEQVANIIRECSS
jgi:TATA-box binding protein (TBP) (component of TFIID and TFIIIB)